jgi:MFS family permease
MLGGWSLGAIIGGRLLKRSGPRFTVSVGMVMVVMGSTWLLFITKMTSLAILFSIMSLIGLGVGVLFMTLMTVVQSSVSRDLRGTATASYTFLRSLGQMIGLAIYGVIFNHMVKAYMVREGLVKGTFDATDYNQLLQNSDESVCVKYSSEDSSRNFFKK